MYRKKRTKTDTSVDMEKIKKQIKQELVAEMRMQNNADAEVVLSQDGVVTNVQSHKPFTRHTEEQLCVRRCRFDRWHCRVGDGGAL
jgi:hypothetical protein